MQIRKLEVRNFCQHAHRDIDFTDGLIAVLGANGSGKSNLLGAIRFALTGENPNVGTKNDNIREQADVAEVSYVSLAFSHAGVSAVVRRNLRPAKPGATLTVETDNTTITGDTSVNAAIEAILGVDRATINDIIIVSQNDIFGALDKTPAVRAAQFQRLFHTEDAEVIYQILGDHLKGVQIPEIVGNPDEIKFNLDNLTLRMQEIDRQLSVIPSFEDMQQRRDNHVRFLNNVSRLEQLYVTAQQRAAMLQQSHWQETQLQNEITKTTQELETVKQAAAGKQAAVTAAHVALQNLSRYQKDKDIRDNLTQRIATFQQQLLELQPPAQPPNYELSTEIARKVSGVQHEQATLTRFLASFDNGVAACPTCGTPTEKLQDKLTAADNQKRVLTSQLEQLTVAHTEALIYEKAKQNYETAYNQLNLQFTQSQQHLAQLPAVPEVMVDEVATRKLVADYKIYEDGIEEFQQILNKNMQTLGQLQGQIETLKAQIIQMEKELSEFTAHSDAEIAKVNADVAAIDGFTEQRRRIETTRATTQTEINQYQKQLAQIYQSRDRIAMLRAWQEYCQELRSLFHKDGAPKFVAQRNLQRLQFSVNETLEMFETDFRVEADENLSFRAMFANGVVQPADRLSQGQRVILALAFRLALNLLLAENIGALYLDEPTAWLDEHHIRGFEPVLTRLREFSASRGLQVIIITHEQQLAPLFDSVIRL